MHDHSFIHSFIVVHYNDARRGDSVLPWQPPSPCASSQPCCWWVINIKSNFNYYYGGDAILSFHELAVNGYTDGKKGGGF
mmetsp:Transcript_1368/g.3527  ORF Transcript_1368/g.3527 Transcript_1368/m.3527 type:complete len:80 (+) Transcript_1368:1754-1993(+)